MTSRLEPETRHPIPDTFSSEPETRHPIPDTFFFRDTLTVARDLIGCTLLCDGVGGVIVETEAYAGDGASHAHRPNRGALMRETHGRIYVYLIYGMYYCLNFTSDAAGPGAVLIRAIRPTTGLEIMRERIGRPQPDHELARGPGKLCRALAIDLSDDNGHLGQRIRVFAPDRPVEEIATSPRIGITKDADLPWRFFVPGERAVSRGKVSGVGYRVSGSEKVSGVPCRVSGKDNL
jgi:DNA-3-methyladenine glycosylase